MFEFNAMDAARDGADKVCVLIFKRTDLTGNKYMKRLGIHWAVSLALALDLAGAAAQTLKDDFSSYRPGTEAGPAWEPNAVGWSVVSGGYEGDSGFSVWRKAPYASALTFACDITVLELLKGEWLTAGISIYSAETNFWGMNLVVTPEAQGRRHHVEMQEMLNGQWLAANLPGSRLQPLPEKGGLNWQVGQTYRMEMRLTSSNIVGRIYQAGNEVAHFGYRFQPGVPCVSAGWPALHVSGLRARFDNATFEVQEVATRPLIGHPPIPRWLSREGKTMAPGTGFFRTMEADGRWWLLDPEGKPFFDVGTDHISYRGHWCEKLGYAPYHRNVVAKYGNEAAWSSNTLERLTSWGFNTLPAGHSASLRHRGLPHILFASFGSSFARREYLCEPIHWTGFPDVFSPRWEGHCRLVAKRMAQESAGDPWCIGTFLDNELEWYGKQESLVDEVFQCAPKTEGKKALFAWLTQRFGTLAGVNRELGTRYADEAGFLNSTNVPKASATLTLVRDEFLAVIAERYFSVPCQALRQADPDHLIMGCRFAGRTPKPVLAAAGKYNDIFTFNTYPRVDFENVWLPDGTGGVVDRVPRELSEFYATVRRPIIITEWSFPALDSGLPCQHGAGMRVDTQTQKAACYRIFANAMADLPYIIGQHYFMWADEPALGISSGFPEDSNYGLVNEQDVPYDAFVRVVTDVNRQSAARHARSRFSGELTLRSQPGAVEIVNTNATDAVGRLRLSQQGQSEIKEVTLKPGETLRLPVKSSGAWVAELQNWDGRKMRVAGGAVPGARALVNASATALAQVPVIVETPQVIATLQNTAPGERIKLTSPNNPIEKRERVELKSATTVWSCTRKGGSLFDSIQSGNLPLGRLAFAAHQKINGQDQWNEPERVAALELQDQRDAWVVEAEVERAAAASGPAGYRARLRAVVFKQLDLALVRPLWVENTDRRTWELAEAFWFCRSAIGGSAADDIVGGPSVPNYYRAAQFITDTKLGGCFGALDQAEGWRVTFWMNPAGGIHPDSRVTVNQELKTGERWTARNTPFLWVYASQNTNVWQDFSRLAKQSAQILMEE
ncbi:MAG: hypothetical protein WCO56_14195 [Verrucomicrobiota bacterium]